jgi:hypothetical protein
MLNITPQMWFQIVGKRKEKKRENPKMFIPSY